MKVLVTGCAGFIGSSLCARLLNKGYEVIGIDNLSTGSKENLLTFLFNPKFTFAMHDLTESFSAVNVDVVIHCALAPLNDTLHFYKTCTQGAFNVAGIARRNKSRIINLLGAATPEYQEEKFFDGLKMVKNILDEYVQVDIRHLYLHNIYGPMMSPKSKLFKIIDASLENRTFEVANSYHLCFIEDTLDAICCAIEKAQGDFTQPINIANNDGITGEDLAKVIIEYTASKSEYTYSQQYRRYTSPSILEAQSILRWSPRVNLKTGLLATIDYVKKFKERQ